MLENTNKGFEKEKKKNCLTKCLINILVSIFMGRFNVDSLNIFWLYSIQFSLYLKGYNVVLPFD